MLTLHYKCYTLTLLLSLNATITAMDANNQLPKIIETTLEQHKPANFNSCEALKDVPITLSHIQLSYHEIGTLILLTQNSEAVRVKKTVKTKKNNYLKKSNYEKITPIYYDAKTVFQLIKQLYEDHHKFTDKTCILCTKKQKSNKWNIKIHLLRHLNKEDQNKYCKKTFDNHIQLNEEGEKRLNLLSQSVDSCNKIAICNLLNPETTKHN